MSKNPVTILFQKNKLIINTAQGKKVIEFKYSIGKVQEFDNCITVMLDPPLNTVFNENIYGISFDGKVIWQVNKIEHVDIDSPYTGISKEGDFLSAYNWDGFNYLIDTKTGNIVDKQFVK